MDIEDSHMKDLGIPPGHVVKLKKKLRELKTVQTNIEQPSVQPSAPPSVQPSVQQPSSDPGILHPTVEMKAIVRKTWENLAAYGSLILGELLFRNFFRLDPDAVQLFPFRRESNLFESPMFRETSRNLVDALSSAFASQQLSPGTPQILQQLGICQVSCDALKQHYKTLGQALLLTVRAGLQDAFTHEVEIAWTSIYSFMAAAMVGESRPEEPAPKDPKAMLCSSGQEIDGGREIYRIEGHLQKAIFGAVYKATGLTSGRSFAVKVLDLDMVNQLGRSQDNQLCEAPLCEVRFMEKLRGLEHVAQMEEHFGNQYYHFVVSELASGGDLLEMLKERPGGFYERQAQDLIRQAAKGLEELHARGLAMQDVSLENMLIYILNDGQWQVQLCDPGQAAPLTFDPSTGSEVRVNFHGFVAKQFRPPELYTKSEYLATKVDSWCLGWSTFYLLVAQPLFHSADPAVHDPDWILFQRRSFARLFQLKGWRSTLSHQAKDFILRLMQIDPNQRMSLRQALRHPWLAEDALQPIFEQEAHVPMSTACAEASPMSSACAEGSPVGEDGQSSVHTASDTALAQARACRPVPLMNLSSSRLSDPLFAARAGRALDVQQERSARSLSPGPVDAFPMNMQSSDWCQAATEPPSPQDNSPHGSEEPQQRQQSYKLTDGVLRVFNEMEAAKASRAAAHSGHEGSGDVAAGRSVAANQVASKAAADSKAPASKCPVVPRLVPPQRVEVPTLLPRRTLNNASGLADCKANDLKVRLQGVAQNYQFSQEALGQQGRRLACPRTHR